MEAEAIKQGQGQEFCRILVLTDEGSMASDEQCGSQSENQMSMDVTLNCQKSANIERGSSDTFSSPCFISIDVEKGATDISKMNQDTGGGIKNEIALTKPLRRQNSLQTGESIPPLMNHILMLLKLDSKEKPAVERSHDAANNRWRKYKRPAFFDSRQIVLLFSILSSMGTIVLIYLTLRVRQVSDGYIQVEG